MRARFAVSLLLPSLLASVAACKDGKETDEEGGCINVNDAGDYATVQEAIDAAIGGDTVFVCDGRYESTLVVTKDLTLAGTGADDVLFVGPTNAPAIEVGPGITLNVSRAGFSSTRSGIVAEAGATVNVTDSAFFAMGNFAVESTDGAVSFTNVEVSGGDWGGISAKGGTVTVTTSFFDGTLGAAVFLEDGATGTFTGNTFQNIFPAGDGTDREDGWAVLVDGGSAVFSGNTFTDNSLGDVFAKGPTTTVSFDGDASTGAIVPLWLEAAAATLSNTTFEDYFQYGIVADGAPTLDLTATTIATTRLGSNPQESVDDLSGSYGVVALGTDVTWEGGRVAGHNGGGIYHTDGTLTLSGVDVDDNARYGLTTYGGTIALTDVDVTNTVDDDATCVDGYTIYCNMAVSVFDGDLSWAGGTLSNAGSYGLAPVFGAADVSGVTFSGNPGAAVFGYEGSFVCEGCVFDGNGEYAIDLESNSSGVLRDTTVRNGSYTYEMFYEDGTSYRSYYESQDVMLFMSNLIIEGGTFENGENGIYAYESTATITDSTWSTYNGSAINSAYASTITVQRSTFTAAGDETISCGSGTLSVEDATIQDVGTTLSKFEFYDADGVLDGLPYESATPGSAIDVWTCDVSLEDVIIENVPHNGIDSLDSALDLDGVKIAGVATTDTSDAVDAAVYARFTSRAPELLINDVSVTGVGYEDGLGPHGIGVYVSGSLSYPGGFVSITGLDIGQPDAEQRSGVEQQGLYLATVGGVTVGDFDIVNTGLAGIYASTVTGTIGDAAGTAGAGSIGTTGGPGIEAHVSTLTIGGVEIGDTVGSGLLLDTGTTTLVSNTVEGADRYGIECVSDPVIVDCATNTLAGDLGATLACDDCAAN